MHITSHLDFIPMACYLLLSSLPLLIWSCCFPYIFPMLQILTGSAVCPLLCLNLSYLSGLLSYYSPLKTLRKRKTYRLYSSNVIDLVSPFCLSHPYPEGLYLPPGMHLPLSPLRKNVLPIFHHLIVYCFIMLFNSVCTHLLYWNIRSFLAETILYFFYPC